MLSENNRYRDLKTSIAKQKKTIEGQEVLQITLNLSSNKQSWIQGKYLLLVMRLKIDDKVNHYFPYPINGHERWLGTRLRIPDTYSSNQINQEMPFKKEMMKHLKSNDIW